MTCRFEIVLQDGAFAGWGVAVIMLVGGGELEVLEKLLRNLHFRQGLHGVVEFQVGLAWLYWQGLHWVDGFSVI